MTRVPSARTLLNFRPNMTRLCIWNCQLPRIKRDDLKGLHNLQELYIIHNGIEYLPHGLFEPTPKLEKVSLAYNKISFIDKDILEPLEKLKTFNLLGNPAIDRCYEETGFFTFAQLQEDIESKCKTPDQMLKAMNAQKKSIEDMSNKIVELENEVGSIKTENGKLKEEIKNLKDTCDAQEKEITKSKRMEIENLVYDFTIKINGKKIRANKDMLIINSPVLAKLIEENGDANSLKLQDISKEMLVAILKFMMTKRPPSEEMNIVELYAASARFEITELMVITAAMLMDKITLENAPDVIKLGLQYGNREMQVKAFAELKKKFPDA